MWHPQCKASSTTVAHHQHTAVKVVNKYVVSLLPPTGKNTFTMMIFHVNGFMDFSHVAWRLIRAVLFTCVNRLVAFVIGSCIDVGRIQNVNYSQSYFCAHTKRLQSKNQHGRNQKSFCCWEHWTCDEWTKMKTHWKYVEDSRTHCFTPFNSFGDRGQRCICLGVSIRYVDFVCLQKIVRAPNEPIIMMEY